MKMDPKKQYEALLKKRNDLFQQTLDKISDLRVILQRESEILGYDTSGILQPILKKQDQLREEACKVVASRPTISDQFRTRSLTASMRNVEQRKHSDSKSSRSLSFADENSTMMGSSVKLERIPPLPPSMIPYESASLDRKLRRVNRLTDLKVSVRLDKHSPTGMVDLYTEAHQRELHNPTRPRFPGLATDDIGLPAPVRKGSFPSEFHSSENGWGYKPVTDCNKNLSYGSNANITALSNSGWSSGIELSRDCSPFDWQSPPSTASGKHTNGDWVEKPDSNMNISTNFPPPPPKLSSPWSAQFTSGANIRTEYFEETKPYQIEDFFKYSEKYRNATKGLSLTSLQQAPILGSGEIAQQGVAYWNISQKAEGEEHQALKEEPLKDLRENFVKEMQKLSNRTAASTSPAVSAKKAAEPHFVTPSRISATNPVFTEFRKAKHVDFKKITDDNLRQLLQTMNAYPYLFSTQERMHLLRESFQRVEIQESEPPELPPKLNRRKGVERIGESVEEGAWVPKSPTIV